MLDQSFPNRSQFVEPNKLGHYLKENTYAQTLHKEYYQKNPNFLNNPVLTELQFKSHDDFKKTDISERTALVQRICETIWKIDLN